ncbi:MAG: glycosyltransferase family 4 protein [Acidimicrobiales bacterium]
MPGRIAVVPPRFGHGVVGGSEALSREIAVGLAGRGWDVEVLTTCATDHYTWENTLPPGAGWEDGLVVRRFPTVAQWSEAGRRAQLRIQRGEIPSLDEQLSWLGWRFTVPGLYDHLLRRGDEYDALLFAPYLFWTTTVCLPVVADRAISMPCLHDETYARLDVVRPALTAPARLWFLSQPEHDLAHRLASLPDAHTVTGAGIDVPSCYHPERFRARYGLSRPFVLYAGRREPEKGWDRLVEQYRDALSGAAPGVDLVTMGVGEVSIPEDLAGRVVDVGRVSDEQRNDALAAAAAYVQPSRMESFSRTIMEAWLAGTPVLAVEDSEVVAWHCRRSGGGLLFRDGPSLAACLGTVVNDHERAGELAQRGRRYVLENYRWDVVLDRMEADLAAMGLPALSSGAVPPAAPPPSTRAGGPFSAERVLVVGSYAPVPATGTGVTERIVRELREAGAEPVVASPRVSAAPLHAAVAGPLAGRRLAHLRQVTGTTDLVLVAERGAPLPAGGAPAPLLRALQRLTARTLAGEMRRFGRVRLVAAGDIGADPRAWATLAAAADELSVADGSPGAVGPLGPAALTGGRIARRGMGLVARRLLGPRAPQVRAAIAARLRRRRRSGAPAISRRT